MINILKVFNNVSVSYYIFEFLHIFAHAKLKSYIYGCKISY